MSRGFLRSSRASKVVWVIHHQGNLRYGASAGIQYPYMSLMLLCRSTFLTAWSDTDFDIILEKNDQLFKSFNQHRLTEVADLPQTVSCYSHPVDY